MVTKTRRSSPAGVICPSKILAYFLNECGYDDATIALFTKQNNTFACPFVFRFCLCHDFKQHQRETNQSSYGVKIELEI